MCLKSIRLEAFGSGCSLIFDKESSSNVNGVATALLRRRKHGFVEDRDVAVVKGKCLILHTLGATHLYNVLRSSFVKRCPTALSSDVRVRFIYLCACGILTSIRSSTGF